MNELINSVASWWKERTTTPLYGLFGFLFIVWNWKIFFSLFFDKSSLFENISRTQFIEDNFLWGNILLSILWIFLIPLLLTAFWIKWMPIIQNWAYKIHIRSIYDRRRIKDEEALAYERDKKQKEQEFSTVTEERAKIRKNIKANEEVIQKSLSDEEKWQIELRQLSESDISAVKIGIRVVYQLNGSFTTRPEMGGNYRIYTDPLALSRLDNLGLVNIQRTGSAGGTMTFTEKGKYFVRILQDAGKI